METTVSQSDSVNSVVNRKQNHSYETVDGYNLMKVSAAISMRSAQNFTPQSHSPVAMRAPLLPAP